MLSVPVFADSIPVLENIPDGLDASERVELSRQREVLEQELKSFQADAAAFNAKARKDQSEQEYQALQTRRSECAQDFHGFNSEIDSTVVDARNVGSGLPPALESAISGAYANAAARRGRSCSERF